MDQLKVEAEIGKLFAETVKLSEESRKFMAESRKLAREAFWHPVAIASGLIGVIAGATLALTKLLG